MFTLPDLPFATVALDPHMSARTLEFHHGKHHKAYVDKLNELVAGTELEGHPLEDVILRTSGRADAGATAIFNNAGQHWNHSFFWNSLSPGGSAPAGELEQMIQRDFGGQEGFAREFASQGAAHFGSGWIWLIQSDAKLQIMTTHDADTPLTQGKQALLCCDLWEHAYYLDYQSRRPEFLEAFVTRLTNWNFAAENLARAHAG